MLLLRAIQEAVDDDWIGPGHICFDKLLNHVRVKEQERSLSGLIVHTLTRLKKAFQQLGSIVIEALLGQWST